MTQQLKLMGASSGNKHLHVVGQRGADDSCLPGSYIGCVLHSVLKDYNAYMSLLLTVFAVMLKAPIILQNIRKSTLKDLVSQLRRLESLATPL